METSDGIKAKRNTLLLVSDVDAEESMHFFNVNLKLPYQFHDHIFDIFDIFDIWTATIYVLVESWTLTDL